MTPPTPADLAALLARAVAAIGNALRGDVHFVDDEAHLVELEFESILRAWERLAAARREASPVAVVHHEAGPNLPIKHLPGCAWGPDQGCDCGAHFVLKMENAPRTPPAIEKSCGCVFCDIGASHGDVECTAPRTPPAAPECTCDFGVWKESGGIRYCRREHAAGCPARTPAAVEYTPAQWCDTCQAPCGALGFHFRRLP